MTLEQIIIQKIKQEGPISFKTFMEMALYYPDLGYYTSPGEKIGAGGDFFTSSAYTPLFGALVAKQIQEMAEQLDEPDFTIVEYGAGTGIFCRDILGYLQQHWKAFDKLRYCIIERSEPMRLLEKQQGLAGNVRWLDNIGQIETFSGCVISNELLDNFAVHRVVMQDQLMEIFVGYENGFIEILKPAGSSLIDYFRQLNVVLPRGYQAEINLEAVTWAEEVAQALKKGFLVTIDYGYSSEELYHTGRKDGTLICYHRHQVISCPYRNIGMQDITAHVNFSALQHWGEKNDLQLTGFTNQANFLMSLGLGRLSAMMDQDNHSAMFARRFLIDLGRKLKVMIQQKGLLQRPLSGLTFATRFV